MTRALRWVRPEDAVTGALLVVFVVATSFVNPAFASVGTLFDLARGTIVPGILAIGVLVVLVSGGLDVSFTAIAVLAMYGAVKVVMAVGLGDHVIFVFAIAMMIGAALGALNGFLIGTLRLPSLIVTLGTLSAYRGFLLTFVGTTVIPTLPPAMRTLARANILTWQSSDGSTESLPALFLVLLAVIAVAALLLNATTLGRSIYAMGGSATAAERIGLRVRSLHIMVYSLVGVTAGVAGTIHAVMNRVANPFDLVGLELTVIAAVVLGGARIEGGHGSVLGTALGVTLVSVMNNTLIMWGVPSTWQNVVLGLLILLGTGIAAARSHRMDLA